MSLSFKEIANLLLRMITLRFAASSAALIALSVLIAATGLLTIRQLESSMEELNQRTLPMVLAIGDFRAAALQFRGDTWKHISAPTLAEARTIESSMDQTRSRLLAALQDYDTNAGEPQQKAIGAQLRRAWESYQQKWLEIREISRSGKEKQRAFEKAAAELHPRFLEMQAQLTAAADFTRQEAKARTASAAAASARGQNTAWATGLAALLVGAALTAWFLRDTRRSVERVAGELLDSARQVASAAQQISGASQQLARDATDQAASIEETSATSQEISSTASQNSSHAESAATLIAETNRQFDDTKLLLEQMVGAMSEIKGSSERISKIIKVIDEIAFQTNLLALNASVEAARAGQAGAGFAVVADEVRGLAQRSAAAAKETGTLIEESVARSRHGADQVDRVASAITGIATSAARIQSLLEEVNASSTEQTAGVSQISKAIIQMERVAQSTAAAAEECAATAEELSGQSQSMLSSLAQLTTAAA